ncbi:hypothetical protein DL93DRAFT_2088938 [Clavulina sp. PMI_390]|nr:hypothetical protein DL93DRAFT_2088938 [Clavulina sp. PMI_390]
MNPAWDPFAFPPQEPIELSLISLCNTIDRNTTFRNGRVVSISGYRRSDSPTTHRFVILQLRRDDGEGQDIWLRLDRMRGAGVSRIQFVLGSSVTKSNDIANLCVDRAQLLRQGGSLEYSRTLPDLPPLGDLSRFLRIMSEEMLSYQIWPENCWFFCSLIEQYLVSLAICPGSNSEWLVAAGIDIKFADVGTEIRQRIFTRYYADDFISSFPPARERLSLSEQTWSPPLKISSNGTIQNRVLCMAGPVDPSFESLRGITIHTVSSHQGRVDDPDRGIWSGFDLAVCRPARLEFPQEALDLRLVRTWTSHKHPAVTTDNKISLQQYVSSIDQRTLLEVASALWDNPGAILLVIGFAQFTGSKNVVEKVSIELDIEYASAE